MFSAARQEPRSLVPLALLLLFVLVCFSGCERLKPIDTKPLDTAGMSYDSIQQLKALKITTPEIAEVVKARQDGLSDDGCVQMMHLYRDRGQPFDAGASIGGLLQAGVAQNTVFELAKINQLGFNAGDLEAMHLAGLSDDILLEVARHHAEGKPVLSGASLAGLKNLGVGESTLLELTRRGISDSQANELLSARRHGAKDSELLRRFAAS
jgi:hypothetical protein